MQDEQMVIESSKPAQTNHIGSVDANMSRPTLEFRWTACPVLRPTPEFRWTARSVLRLTPGFAWPVRSISAACEKAYGQR